MFKLIYSSKWSNDLCIGFDHSRECKQQELTNKETVKGNYHVRIMHYEVFNFAEHHKNAAISWRYLLTGKRKNDKVVENRHNTIGNDKTVITGFGWYGLHYKPNVKQQVELSEPIWKEVATELAYMKRCVCVKDLTFKNYIASFEKVFKF